MKKKKTLNKYKKHFFLFVIILQLSQGCARNGVRDKKDHHKFFTDHLTISLWGGGAEVGDKQAHMNNSLH